MNTMSVAIATVTIFILFFANVPIAFSLIVGTLVYMLFSADLQPMIMIQRMMAGVESIPLLAIPFFVAAGALMTYSGIARRMTNFAEVFTGHLPGGLAQVNILLSTMMGGLSGSSVASSAMFSKIMFPQMAKRGYSAGFSTSVIATSAVIDAMIPPAIGMILYGFIGNVSVGKLFLAGIFPGILLCALLMVTTHFISKKRNYLPYREKMARPKEILFASKDAILALLLPVIIIGGIRGGMFTPTEAGAIAVIYALVLGLLFYREMKFHHFKEALRETVSVSASILVIIASGSAFAWILTWERIPQTATEFVTGLVDSPIMFLFIINIFLLLLGMFMEGNVAIIILTPLLMPMVQSYGIDPVHFGIILLFNLALGTIHPPLGTIMYTTCQVTGTKIEDFVKEVIPFLLVMILELLLITYIPWITMWLPNLLM
ncbi:tripartite ATP-independent transporter DctM subunit [Neobacillus niacini]|uniref:TRAP transporter large permease n=1 Tax=Neobacillus niacini TaxID=86668 RepID=UPI00285BBEF3|nr:TRAP transporter large permease [Neobacillus niacini]MDR7080018.1 tripartite ATP-independent transporter DctM subunit [Neobacillus niacini]